MGKKSAKIRILHFYIIRKLNLNQQNTHTIVLKKKKRKSFAAFFVIHLRSRNKNNFLYLCINFNNAKR